MFTRVAKLPHAHRLKDTGGGEGSGAQGSSVCPCPARQLLLCGSLWGPASPDLSGLPPSLPDISAKAQRLWPWLLGDTGE